MPSVGYTGRHPDMFDTGYKIGEKSPKGIDLFCGAGGLSLGFLMAGGHPLGGVDNDRDSIETFKNLFQWQLIFIVEI